VGVKGCRLSSALGIADKARRRRRPDGVGLIGTVRSLRGDNGEGALGEDVVCHGVEVPTVTKDKPAHKLCSRTVTIDAESRRTGKS
jgi:hypothetical protein